MMHAGYEREGAAWNCKFSGFQGTAVTPVYQSRLSPCISLLLSVIYNLFPSAACYI